MTAILAKDLGKAGAFLGDESGPYTSKLLRSVLLELAMGGGGNLDAHQATIAAATIGGKLITRASKLVGLRTSVEVTGSADDTIVQVHVNGSAVTGAELTTDNADADGIKKSVAITEVALVAGDLVELVVSAAPTAGTGLDASAEILPDITVET